MSEAQNDEKTEEATQTRRDDYRKRGQVASSRELGTAIFLLVGAGLIFGLSKMFFAEIFELFQASFGINLVAAVKTGDMMQASVLAGTKFALMALPALGICFLIGIVSQVVQVGFLQVEDALTPKFERLDPLGGLKRIFSLKNLVEGLKSILKVGLAFGVGYLVLKSEFIRLPYLMNLGVAEAFVYIGGIAVRLFGWIGATMLVLSAADYFFQAWDLEKQMMMTKQEVKEEAKSREVDPMVKSRMRKIQRDLANRRMMQKVPTADVIITNPTHIAVALKYDDGLPAPQLIAKGADLVAERIRELAKEHNIPIIENKPLARTIFKSMKLGQVIPRELYVAVAEVLSYVFKLKRKLKRGSR